MCNQILSTVTYNRKTKAYEVAHEGEIYASFPPQAKSLAGQTAINHDDPQLHSAAAYLVGLFPNNQEIQRRIWRAALIVVKGKIYAASPLHYRSGIFAHVEGSDEDQPFYTVTRYPDRHESRSRYGCTCFDFLNHLAPIAEDSTQPLCKHIIAAKLMLYLDRPLPHFTRSPKEILPWLDETGAEFDVVGTFNGNDFTAYGTASRRRAVIGEVVQYGERYFRLIGSAQKIRTHDVTEEMKKEYDPRNGMSRSYAAHLTASYADMEPPRPCEENEELGAALLKMAAAAGRNYPSKARMTDLDQAETNALLFG